MPDKYTSVVETASTLTAHHILPPLGSQNLLKQCFLPFISLTCLILGKNMSIAGPAISYIIKSVTMDHFASSFSFSSSLFILGEEKKTKNNQFYVYL